MPQHPTVMRQEAEQTPDIVERQLRHNEKIIAALVERLQRRPPRFVLTVARGSSDKAATFAKYLFETRLGLVTASAAPSVLTIYGKQPNCRDSLVLGISQSGQSPDICEVFAGAKADGAVTAALVNNVDSPLAQSADYVIPLHAGIEKSVAATKSFLATLTAIIQFTACYSRDRALADCLNKLPATLRQSLAADTRPLLEALRRAEQLFVLARGYGFAMAQEVALKFKETMALHAEAISGAEVHHGPMAAIRENSSVLMLTQHDSSEKPLLQLANELHRLPAKVLLTMAEDRRSRYRLPQDETVLRLPPSLHPICDPLAAVTALYPMIAELAVLRGFDPDRPEHLQKVTETR